MGTGSSKSGKAGKKIATRTKAKTPSGVSYDQFMKMSDDEKYKTTQDIINDPNIKVPDYLDKSDTSKVMYALGMDNKPTVVSESQLDAMPGADLYRTVYDTRTPPPYAKDILDQIRVGDYTQLSGSGGSAHGRALYFARKDYGGSASYGNRDGANGKKSLMMRAKINPNAKIVRESTIVQAMNNDKNYSSKSTQPWANHDAIALYALSHGIDGWYSGSYTMIVNRGVLTASSQSKSLYKGLKRGGVSTRVKAKSWAEAGNVN